MPHLVYKYAFIALFMFFFGLGFVIGNAVGGVATHALPKGITPRVAITWAVILGVAMVLGIPLAGWIVGRFPVESRFGGYGQVFWITMLAVCAIAGGAFGAFYPFGPFTTV